MALEPGCSRVTAGIAYETATLTSRIQTIVGTRTQVVQVPTVSSRPPEQGPPGGSTPGSHPLTLRLPQVSLSTYLGTIRGQPTSEIFTVTERVAA